MTESTPLDAVIVGAGISGLATAWRLEQAGQRVVVCEARPRVGGRLLSALPSGATAPVDLGATWIWPGEPHVTALVDALGIETYPHDDAGTMLYDDPAGPQPISGIEQATPSLRVVGGTAAMTEALAARLGEDTVRLSSVVEAVHHRGDRMRVAVVGRAPVEARHVVMALPPALAVAAIRFSPRLPADLAQRAAATPVWMGNIIKTVAVYDTPFWRTQGLAGTAVSHLGPLDEIHDISGPGGSPAALFGFTAAMRPGELPPPRAAVVAQLGRLFGPDALRPREVLQQDWRREAYTSPPGVEALRDYGLFGHAVFARPHGEGRLHFASCETSGVSGHIEEALAAAARTARAVLAFDG